MSVIVCSEHSLASLTMETILEQQRRYHEEKERLMDAKTKEMLHKKSTVSCPLTLALLLIYSVWKLTCVFLMIFFFFLTVAGTD